jgi:putative hydrolase of the HAD superfamily
MIAAVLFDLDDTIHDRARSMRCFLADQHQRVLKGRAHRDSFIERFLELDAQGNLPKSILYPKILAELQVEDVLAEILLDEYGKNFCAHAQIMEGARSLLEELRFQEIKLAIVTNGWTDFQNRTIDAIGVRDAVDAILISEAEGLRKPDARLFRRAAARLGVLPQECIFVGDNPENDVAGAEAAGMKSVWLRRGFTWPSTQAYPEIAIDDIFDVLQFVSS